MLESRRSATIAPVRECLAPVERSGEFAAAAPQQSRLFGARANAEFVAQQARQGVAEIGSQPLRLAFGAIDVGPEGPSAVVELPFADRHHHAAEAAVHALHIGGDAIQAKPPLGEVDQMRSIVLAAPGQRRGGHDPARVAAQRFEHTHR